MFGIVVSILLQAVPITIGAIYKDDCPVEPLIPIWCINHGCMTMLVSILELTIVLRKETNGKTAVLIRIIEACVPILFIVGCVFTYRNYQPQYLAETSNYCNKTLYLLIFWYITAHFILLLVALSFGCFGCCSIALLALRMKVMEKGDEHEEA